MTKKKKMGPRRSRLFFSIFELVTGVDVDTWHLYGDST